MVYRITNKLFEMYKSDTNKVTDIKVFYNNFYRGIYIPINNLRLKKYFYGCWLPRYSSGNDNDM